MKDLNLPIIKDPMKKTRLLSMDEYIAFVDFNLKHFPIDRESYRKQKRLLAVDVPFKLK